MQELFKAVSINSTVKNFFLSESGAEVGLLKRYEKGDGGETAGELTGFCFG